MREGDSLTLLNVYRAYEVAGRSRSWCTANRVSASALARAAETRTRLRTVLAALVTQQAANEDDAVSASWSLSLALQQWMETMVPAMRCDAVFVLATSPMLPACQPMAPRMLL